MYSPSQNTHESKLHFNVLYRCLVLYMLRFWMFVANAQQSPGMWSLSAHYQQILHQKGTPYTSNPLDQPDKPRQITYVTMTNERWKWMVRGHVGPNPGSPQWNEYKTELYPVPNLWLMDPHRSGIDRWSLLAVRLPLWEIVLHRVWKTKFGI